MNIFRRLSSQQQPNLSKFTKRSFNSFKSPADPSLVHGIHVFHCPDAVGIVAKLSECIASRGGNILGADVFVPENKPIFYSRSDFIFDPSKWPRAQMDADFLTLGAMFSAMKSVVRVPDLDPKYKIAVFASKQDHCLVDLLHAWQDKRLPVDITCVIRLSMNTPFPTCYVTLNDNAGIKIYTIFAVFLRGSCSNHHRDSDSHAMRFLERYQIPYHFLNTTAVNKREEEILDLVHDTDFLILARYMQILSGNFLKKYGRDIINIHHGLLPSFKGGNPSRQAFDYGVKMIGATAHFVTEELDAGAIIEQMVERVSHRDNFQSFVQKSENLEKQCLAKAIKCYCELRVLPFLENKTVVF